MQRVGKHERQGRLLVPLESGRIATQLLAENVLPAALAPVATGSARTGPATADSLSAGSGKLGPQKRQGESQPGPAVGSDMNFEINEVAFHTLRPDKRTKQKKGSR
jgi:hypothetical protein